MKKTVKRIISLVLILTLLCTIPIYAGANVSSGSQTPGANGTSTNITSQNTRGTWNNQHQGMRIYAIDKSGRLVSNVIDVVKDDCYTKYKQAEAKGLLRQSTTTKTGETPDASKWEIYSESEANELFFNRVCELYKKYAENPEVSGITNVVITGDAQGTQATQGTQGTQGTQDTLTWDEYARDANGHPITPTPTAITRHTVKKSSASVLR